MSAVDEAGPLAVDRLRLARVAVDAVEHDLRASSLGPAIEIHPWDGDHVQIVVDGGYTAPSMWATSQAEATVEVADYVQEQIAQDLGCWPVCAVHDSGLTPQLDDAGAAVWRCLRGAHVVAGIGALPNLAR